MKTFTLEEFAKLRGSGVRTLTLEEFTAGRLSVAKLGKVLNFGCGHHLIEGAVNSDAFVRGEGITPTGTYKWDFADNSFDAVVSFKVLEHTLNPARIAGLIYRVLKPGGITWNSVAFCEHYHPLPDHYYNITPGGARALFHRFEDVEVFACPITPPSELCYTIQCWRDAARKSGSTELANAIEKVLRIASKSDDRIRGSKEAMEMLLEGAPSLVVRGVKPHV